MSQQQPTQQPARWKDYVRRGRWPLALVLLVVYVTMPGQSDDVPHRVVLAGIGLALLLPALIGATPHRRR